MVLEIALSTIILPLVSGAMMTIVGYVGKELYNQYGRRNVLKLIRKHKLLTIGELKKYNDLTSVFSTDTMLVKVIISSIFISFIQLTFLELAYDPF